MFSPQEVDTEVFQQHKLFFSLCSHVKLRHSVMHHLWGSADASLCMKEGKIVECLSKPLVNFDQIWLILTVI